METISDRLRRAIAESGVSGTEISRATGVTLPVLSRFMNRGDQHRDIRLERTADKLAAYFGLELMQATTDGRSRKSKVGKPKRPKR